MLNESAVIDVDIPGLEFQQGKVGHTADLTPEWFQPPAHIDPDTRLALTIRGDGISAFNHKLTPGIPGRGMLLHEQTELFRVKMIEGLSDDCITSDVSEFGERLQPHASLLKHRAKIIEKGYTLGAECVWRNALDGTGWKQYLQTGQVCGVRLPADLQQYEEFPAHLGLKFTPTLKSEKDEAITFDQMVERIKQDYPRMAVDIADYARERTLEFARLGIGLFQQVGLRLGDGKFEFFCRRPPTADRFDVQKEIFIGDEYHTGDSSRIWPAGPIEKGQKPLQYSKQFIRDWLLKQGYNPESGTPPPPLSDEVVRQTIDMYRIPFEKLAGRTFEEVIQS